LKVITDIRNVSGVLKRRTFKTGADRICLTTPLENRLYFPRAIGKQKPWKEAGVKKFSLLVTALFFVLLMFGSVQSTDLAGKWGLAAHGGLYKLGLSDRSDVWTVGALVQSGLKYGLSDKLMLGVEGQGMQTWLSDSTERAGKGAGFTFNNQQGGPRQRAFMVGLTAEYHFRPQKGWSPYIFGGPGLYIWKWTDANWNTLSSNDSSLSQLGIPALDNNGQTYELKDKELYALFGLGIEFFAGEHLSLELGGKFRYLTHLFTDFKGSKDIVGKGAGQLDLPKATGEVYAGLTLYFGGGKAKDEDADGVSDKKDKCPGTPVGCRVDVAGCPVDADGDGVCDGIDACANTPKGSKVDAKGCPTDADGDGVFDGLDKCPNTPKGCTVDASGCPKDSDNDGFCDGLDKCADTPQGCMVDSTGCPVDSDKDGVCDGLDQCYDTPAGTKVNAVGCPIPTVEFIPEPEKPIILKGVNFASNKATLLDTSKVILDMVAASLAARPDVKVEIGGHTDATGPAEYNLKLSEGRAASVRDYLVEKGVKPENLSIRGYGETKPIADNKSASGRAQNRRVELTRVQ
jgi:outer membrane protein OmpA-like peptidoglycan-associated protein/opacity protein-like surface antigen